MFIGLSSIECYGSTRISEHAFAIFQMMFAAITPLLLTGAFAERLVWKSFIAFVVMWEVCLGHCCAHLPVLVYYPVAHWVWGDGWLAQLGTVDFAGGLVIHTTCVVHSMQLSTRVHSLLTQGLVSLPLCLRGA